VASRLKNYSRLALPNDKLAWREIQTDGFIFSPGDYMACTINFWNIQAGNTTGFVVNSQNNFSKNVLVRTHFY